MASLHEAIPSCPELVGVGAPVAFRTFGVQGLGVRVYLMHVT